MWEGALTQLIYLNVKKWDLGLKYISCKWLDAVSVTCIAEPLFSDVTSIRASTVLFWLLLLLLKFTALDIQGYFIQCGSELVAGVLIAHSWPHFAKSFSALAFKLLATVIVGRKRIKLDSSHQLLICDFLFSSVFLPFTPFLCYIKENTDIFPLNLDSSHRLSLLRFSNQISLV